MYVWNKIKQMKMGHMIIFHDIKSASADVTITRVGGMWLAATALPLEYWWLHKTCKNIYFIFLFHIYYISAVQTNQIKIKFMLKEAFVSHLFYFMFDVQSA